MIHLNYTKKSGSPYQRKESWYTNILDIGPSTKGKNNGKLISWVLTPVTKNHPRGGSRPYLIMPTNFSSGSMRRSEWTNITEWQKNIVYLLSKSLWQNYYNKARKRRESRDETNAIEGFENKDRIHIGKNYNFFFMEKTNVWNPSWHSGSFVCSFQTRLQSLVHKSMKIWLILINVVAYHRYIFCATTTIYYWVFVDVSGMSEEI